MRVLLGAPVSVQRADMVERDTIICAYDIADPQRGRWALRVARDGGIDAQLSVHEVLVSGGEARMLRSGFESRLDLASDCCLLLRLDPRSAVSVLGIPRRASDFLYFG